MQPTVMPLEMKFHHVSCTVVGLKQISKKNKLQQEQQHTKQVSYPNSAECKSLLVFFLCLWFKFQAFDPLHINRCFAFFCFY